MNATYKKVTMRYGQIRATSRTSNGIQKDNLSTFMHEEQEGRPNRVFLLRKDFGTVGQFKISPHR